VPIISAHTEARLEGYFGREWKLAIDFTTEAFHSGDVRCRL
jgi:hypothetical protein